MSRRTVYPLISTNQYAGAPAKSTMSVNGRDVEIDARDVDDLPEAVDRTELHEFSNARRRTRNDPAKRAFNAALANPGEAPAADPFDDD